MALTSEIGADGALVTASTKSNDVISQVAGISDMDVEVGLEELLQWKLAFRSVDKNNKTIFRLNSNTRRLARDVFKDAPQMDRFKSNSSCV